MLDTRSPATLEASEAPGIPARRRGRGAVLVALTVILLAELGVRAIAGRLPEPSAWTQRLPGVMLEQMRAHGLADAVFLGSSAAGNAFDPATFEQRTGLTAYNAGMQRAGMEGIDRWAREFVIPTLRPRVAIIGLVSRDLNDNGPLQAAFVEEYLASPGRAQALGLETAALRAERLAADVSALVRYRRYLRRPFDLADQVLRGTDALEPRIEIGARGEPLDAAADAPFHAQQWPFPHRNGELLAFDITKSLHVLEQLIGWLRGQGIDVVLVDIPVVESIYVPYHPRGRDDLGAYRGALRALAVRAGVALLAPDHTGWDPREIRVDDIHLNRRGAVLTTRDIAGMLRERDAAS